MHKKLVSLALAGLAIVRPLAAGETPEGMSPEAYSIAEYCLKFGEKDIGGYDSVTFQTTPPIGKKFQHFISERQKNEPVTWEMRVADRAPEGKIGREDMLEIICRGVADGNNQHVHDVGLTGKGYRHGGKYFEGDYKHLWGHLMLNTKSFEHSPDKVTERTKKTLKALTDCGTSIEEISGGSSNQ